MPRPQREEVGRLKREMQAAILAEHRALALHDRHAQEATRWQARAEWAATRGEADLAERARQRAIEQRRLAGRIREAVDAEAARIRILKRRMRAAEVGALSPLLAAPVVDDLEARFERLQREERLEHDLTELKAGLSKPPPG